MDNAISILHNDLKHNERDMYTHYLKLVDSEGRIGDSSLNAKDLLDVITKNYLRSPNPYIHIVKLYPQLTHDQVKGAVIYLYQHWS